MLYNNCKWLFVFVNIPVKLVYIFVNILINNVINFCKDLTM